MSDVLGELAVQLDLAADEFGFQQRALAGSQVCAQVRFSILVRESSAKSA